jgi:Tol biopolymer transport system component
VTGLNEVFRGIFGRVPFILFPFFTSMPNLWQPTWLIEGLATYEETQLGMSDRRDGTFTEMILRTAILEDKFPKLDQAGGLDQWPAGFIPYLFGSKFYQYITQKYGERYLAEISRSYSERTFPFFIESNAKAVLRSPYRTLWSEWKSTLQEKYTQEKITLESQGLTSSQRLTDRGYMILGPTFSPDGQSIAYSEINTDTYPSLRIIGADGTKDRLLSLKNSGFHHSWSPDGQQIAFAQMEVYKNYSFYSDLYLLDVKTRKIKHLTHGLRARDPAFSPDGTKLVFVLNKLGQSQLAILDLKSLDIQTLTESIKDIQYAQPRWSPDGQLIALSVWHKGHQDIALFDPVTRVLKLLTDDASMDLTPTWSPDGQWIYFTSERTGIYNIFAFSMSDGRLYQITNVLGGAFMPYPSPDGKWMAMINYTARGFDLHVMGLDPRTWKETWASFPMADAKTDTANSEAHQTMPLKSFMPHSYSPSPTILPRFWAPILGGDEDGLQAGLLTGGLDVLGKHKYSLVALYGIESQRLAYNLLYQNDQFYPALRLRLSDLAFLHADLLRNPSGQEIDYWERQRRVTADVIMPALKFQWSQQISLGYLREQLSSVTAILGGFQVPEEGVLSGVRIAWGYNSAKQYGYSLGREDGRRLQVSYEHMEDGLGSDFTINRYVGGWYEYLTLPYLKHHILAGRLVGGLATGDVLLQRAFQLGSPLITEEIITLDETSYFLRGYPARRFRGQRMALASLEYRFPIVNIERGIRTWPFFFRRIHGTLFADTGNTWDKHTRISDFKTGVGGEIKLDMNLAYHLRLSWRLGMAYGLDDEGVLRGYLAVGNAF